MAKDKKSFVFNCEWQEVLRDFPAEVRLEVYDAIIDYVATGRLAELKPLARMAFLFIKKEVDMNNAKYDETVKKRSEAGKKGMASRFGGADAASAGACPAGVADADAEGGRVGGCTADEAAHGVEGAPPTTSDNKNNNVIKPITSDNKNNNVIPPITKITNITDNEYDSDNDNELTNVSIGRGEAARAATLARREKFRQELGAYAAQYGEAMLADFFGYWAETNRSGTKMRYEQQPTWETARRLATWARKENDYGNRKRNNNASGASTRREEAVGLVRELLAEGCCAH